MLLRLILAVMLMLGGVAADAASPCCDTPKMSQAMAGNAMPGHAPAKALPAHNCIGCVPPSTLLPTRIAAPILPMAVPPVAQAVRLDLGRSVPPSLPPPQIG
jgi:hypothetical protein